MELMDVVDKHKIKYHENSKKIKLIETLASDAFDKVFNVFNSYKKHWGDDCPLKIEKGTAQYKKLTLTFAEYQLIFDFDYANIENISHNALVLRYALIWKEEAKAPYENFAAVDEENGQWFIIKDDNPLIEWEKGFNDRIESLLNTFINHAIKKMYLNYVP